MEHQVPIYQFSDPDDPQVVAEELASMLRSGQGSTRIRNDRERPYDGQPWTDNGIRGATLVEGLTMRDVVDCLVQGFLLSSGPGEPYSKAINGTWIQEDIFKVDLHSLDPMAVAQNMLCCIERYMGIFPNIPKVGHLS
mgnify:FL=1